MVQLQHVLWIQSRLEAKFDLCDLRAEAVAGCCDVLLL